MPGPSGESCGACYFLQTAYIRIGDESQQSVAKRSQDAEGYAGFCHRCPPFHEDQAKDPFHPSVDIDDWCGEFKPLKPEGTE